MAHPYWPLFDLCIRTPRLELRLPTDDELLTIAEVAVAGVHAPDEAPFKVPWTRQPSPQLERELLKWNWRNRAAWDAGAWRLCLAAFLDGRPVGMQDVAAEDYVLQRSVHTGSWLGLPWHGQGLGKEMRAGVLHLAFAGLGAEAAHTSAWHDNPASLGVTRAMGYEQNGWILQRRGGERVRHLRFAMDRARWEAHRSIEVELDGLEPCLELFGLAADRSPLPQPA